jgi:type VI secretion system protein ImpA
MASPDILDFERLLAPIAGENPAGTDLRQDTSSNPVYYRIKDARSAARAAERRREALDASELDGGSAGTVQEWRTVLELAPDVLAERSKDLEVTAWLIEALVRTHGFAGLRDGFRLARELVEGFWETLYPEEDEDGVLTKVAPLAGLNGEGAEGTLIQPIRKVPITDSPDLGAFGLWHHEQGSKLLEIPEDKRAQRIAAGAVTLEQFEQSARASPALFYRTIVPDLELCQTEFGRLNAALQERCGADAPPSSRIDGMLAAAMEVLQTFGKDALAQDVAQDAAGEAAPGADGAAPAGRSTSEASVAADGQIRTRDDAFRTLLKVAEFFRQAEPHSPISYTLEEVVRRGRMPLPALLAELIPVGGARRAFLTAAGIKPAEDEA